MGKVGPRTPVNPAARLPWRTGLESVARVVNDDRWQTGISFMPDLCGDVADAISVCDPIAFGPDQNSALSEWDPVELVFGQKMSTMGCALADISAQIQRLIDRQTWSLLETVLWRGEVATSGGVETFAVDGSPNGWLAQAPTLVNSGNPIGVVAGLGMLYEAWSQSMPGEAGIVHVPPRLLPFLEFYGVVIKEGTRLLSAGGDHRFVVGNGYDGSASNGTVPAGATRWVYMSAPVEARLGPPVRMPAPDEIEAAVNRVTNVLEWRAVRPALVSFDPCYVAGVQICLPDPGPACT